MPDTEGTGDFIDKRVAGALVTGHDVRCPGTLCPDSRTFWEWISGKSDGIQGRIKSLSRKAHEDILILY